MHEVCFDRRSRYVSTVARGIFRPSWGYVSTVYEVCFDRVRVCFVRRLGYLSTMLEKCFRPCSRYALTGLEVCFDRRSRYVFTVLEVCFGCARIMFPPSFEVCFDHVRDKLRPYSMYVSIVLEVRFDRARRML